MKTAIIRLDGVLIPPIWQQIADVTGIPCLVFPPGADDASKSKVRQMRLKALGQLRKEDLQFIVSMYWPLDGAEEFVRTLKQEYRIIAVSDAPSHLARHFTEMLGGIEFHAVVDVVHHHGIDAIVRFKSNAAMAASMTAGANETVVIGHTALDIPILNQGTVRVLFRPSPQTAASAHGVIIVYQFDEIMGHLGKPIPRVQMTCGKRA